MTDSKAGRPEKETAAAGESPDSEGVDAEVNEAREEAVIHETAALQGELDVLNDRHLRLAAEFDNYRRRAQVQLGEAGVRAQASLVGKLLEVLDDFERVTSLDVEAASVESLLEGIAMVERKLSRLLEEAGLEEIDPEGEPFDPNVMEAMARVPAESPEEDDQVDQVLQKGFRFGGQLVRPARVSVRKFE